MHCYFACLTRLNLLDTEVHRSIVGSLWIASSELVQPWSFFYRVTSWWIITLCVRFFFFCLLDDSMLETDRWYEISFAIFESR